MTEPNDLRRPEAIQANRALRDAAPAPLGEAIEPAAHAPPRPVASDLLGRDVFVRPRFPGGSLFMAILGLSALGFLAYGNWQATAIITPFFLAMAGVYGSSYFRPASFRLTEEGIHGARPKRFIPYDAIRQVTAGKGSFRSDFPIHVIANDALLTFPKDLTCDSQDLLLFLQNRVVPARGLASSPALFDAFLKQQRLIYSEDEIHVFRGVNASRGSSRGPLLKFAFALLLPLPLWIGLAVAFPRSEVFVVMSIIAGILAAIVGLIGFVAGLSPRIKNALDAVLIVTPAGIALRQDDLRGELRWSEVQKIRISSGRSFEFQWTAQPAGIGLKVQGAEIVIADIYEWPLDAIAALIERYSGK